MVKCNPRHGKYIVCCLLSAVVAVDVVVASVADGEVRPPSRQVHGLLPAVVAAVVAVAVDGAGVADGEM